MYPILYQSVRIRTYIKRTKYYINLSILQIEIKILFRIFIIIFYNGYEFCSCKFILNLI